MNAFRLFVPALLAGVLGAALACGDSTGSGPVAASVTGVAGDSQSAPTGAQLSFPLSFVTLGSGGQPVQGVNVTWSVAPQGGATFVPATSTSDVNGNVSTNVTVGVDTGDILIKAGVPGISPISFHAHVLNPCVYFAPYTIGDTVNGKLSTTDCNRQSQGFYYDFYRLQLPSGQQSVRIAMNSTAFDTYVDLWRMDAQSFGPYFGFDDDVVLGQIQNSQLDIILPGDTSYIIGANSFAPFTTGAYSLVVTPRAAAMNGCRQVWVARGVTVNDSITANDCRDSSATPHYYDVARIVVYGGTVLSISEQSTVMNPALAMYQLDPNNYGRTLVASNDDSSATNTNAFIGYSVTANNIYDILIGTSTGGETGAYTFTVSTSTTFSPHATAPTIGTKEWWRSPALPKRPKAT